MLAAEIWGTIHSGSKKVHVAPLGSTLLRDAHLTTQGLVEQNVLWIISIFTKLQPCALWCQDQSSALGQEGGKEPWQKEYLTSVLVENVAAKNLVCEEIAVKILMQ